MVKRNEIQEILTASDKGRALDKVAQDLATSSRMVVITLHEETGTIVTTAYGITNQIELFGMMEVAKYAQLEKLPERREGNR